MRKRSLRVAGCQEVAECFARAGGPDRVLVVPMDVERLGAHWPSYLTHIPNQSSSAPQTPDTAFLTPVQVAGVSHHPTRKPRIPKPPCIS